MKKPTSTPHDAVFKTYLSHPDTARDFLQLYLPETLLKVCDLRTLHLESGHFVEDDLRPFYADILYSLKTTAGDGYIYALIEHQSTPDRAYGLSSDALRHRRHAAPSRCLPRSPAAGDPCSLLPRSGEPLSVLSALAR